jgi:hypothetical protein
MRTEFSPGKDSAMATALVALFAAKIFAMNMGFASATGIVCGWQPMPDGSPSYECVVQLEPELLDSLKHGDSIPLSVEIPEHVRPINRIRIVVGTGTVPQRTLATNLKPWPEAVKQSRDGVVETQFTTNNDGGRYNYQQATNGAVVPLNGYVSDAQNAFARSLQNGGQAVRDTMGQVAQDVLPPEPGRSIANAIDRAGQDLGNNLRSASQTVREDIRQLFGEESTAEGGSPILPPGGTQVPATRGQAVQPILPADSNNTGNIRRLDQPLDSRQRDDWQSSPQIDTIMPPANDSHSAGQLPVGNNSFPSAQGNNTRPEAAVGDRYNMPTATNNVGVAQQNNSFGNHNQADQFNNAAPWQNGGLATSDARNSMATQGPPVNTGPSFPSFTPSLGNEQPITPTPTSMSSTPEIRRDMLHQPANAAIQGANGLPIGQQPILQSQQVASQVPTQAIPAPTDFGWPTKSQQQVGVEQAGSPQSVFPLLLSWVLLSGSGAGNLYLFWSYLDVRNKYRDLVDDASRRISGRRIRD